MTPEAHAILHVPFEPVREHVVAQPMFEDRHAILPDGTLELTFGVGWVRLAPTDDHHTALLVRAEDAAGLQLLRDFVTDTAQQAGITPEWRERHRRGRPANLCLARVTAVDRISPSYRRITVAGPDLMALTRGGLHFRLLLAPAGADWPQIDEAGLTDWPGGTARWHRPVYTIRAISGTDAGLSATFDIFLHDGGRVTAWSETLRVGDEVALMGPSGGTVPDNAGWVAIYGDETALPVIARILAGLPAGTVGEAVIRIPDAADRQPLPRPEGIALRWQVRSDGADLLVPLADLRPPATDRFVFFAASRTEAAAARHILGTLGLAKKEFWAQAYWLDGVAPPEEE